MKANWDIRFCRRLFTNQKMFWPFGLATSLLPICQNHRLTVTSDTWSLGCNEKIGKIQLTLVTGSTWCQQKPSNIHLSENSLTLPPLHTHTPTLRHIYTHTHTHCHARMWDELSLVETSKFVGKRKKDPHRTLHLRQVAKCRAIDWVAQRK